jgi:hypothetical protein
MGMLCPNVCENFAIVTMHYRGTIAQDIIEVDTKAEESTRETKEKLDGRNKEGHEREEPARRPVGR